MCSPYFLFPVPKEKGTYYTLLSQWQGKHCIMTYLEAFRRDPTKAEPYMSVTFYDDFLEKKGVVLARADFSAHLTKDEAKRLLAMLRYYYLTNPTMVEVFNQFPDKFDFQRLVEESC